MALPIFGASNKGNPGNKIIGGSSMAKEKAMRDLKLSSRIAKSDMKTAKDQSDFGKKIVGRVSI